MTTIALKNSIWFSKILDAAEKFFWQDELASDEATNTIYMFKRYPEGLKGSNLDNWVSLQERHLNPFQQGDVYSFRSGNGLGLWFSKSELRGLPETAAQAVLTDGVHLVKCANLFYKQHWQRKEMLSCEIISQDQISTAEIIRLSQTPSKPWAYERKIDKAIKTPVFWAMILTCFFLLFFSYFTGAYIANTFNASSLEEEEIRIQDELGDKLALQDRQQKAKSMLGGMRDWASANGNLPMVLSIVIGEVLQQSPWYADAFDWQGNKLTVVLRTSSLDIAVLVSNIEKTGQFENVSIRPNNRPNTWNLEVTIKDV